jgi:flavin-dependent dehydrogenase
MVFDVAVIGGGPAGATAARLLAEWGHEVTLLARPLGPRPPLAESLPPSTGKVLSAVGALEQIEAASFLHTTGNTSWWRSDQASREAFAPGAHGWQVLRADLEGLLLSAAAAAGTRVRANACVRRVDLGAREGVLLDVAAGEREAEQLEARVVLDASGRAGVIARRGWRVREGSVTLALSRVWRRGGGFPVPDDTQTLVEAYADGWAWSVPIALGLRHVTVMIDPRDRTNRRSRGLAGLYHEELGKTRHLRALVSDAERGAGPWGADASTYTARAFAGPHHLLVGDAASFIDPLSSYGVKKALASAWLAAVTVNTGFRHPERAEMARTFFDERERVLYSSYARESARYAQESASRYPSSSFWRDRARTDEGRTSGPGRGDDEGRPAADPRGAFEALRTGPRGRVQVAPGARHESRPAVHGNVIELTSALVSPVTGVALRFSEGVDAVALARLLEAPVSVPEAFEAYNRAAAPIALPEFLRALSVLLAGGFLVHEVSA